MPLFQKSVQKKYINNLNKTKVDAAYIKLNAHFGHPEVQQNIRFAKEEQYQEGFLRELFVDVLGYILNPQPNYNLTTEYKNEINNKKSDGSILLYDEKENQQHVKAIIELKSMKTTNLQNIELQAFGYKNSQKNCRYVITANFQKLRFYIDNIVDFEEFDLFTIDREKFDLLYLCLHADNLLTDLPLRLKQASLEQEKSITKSFYIDYSGFKQDLYKDLIVQNKNIDSLILFKKTQKLLDRFLFMLFAEDKGLIQPNSVIQLLNDWEYLKKLDTYDSLYNRFKKFFGYLKEGYQSSHCHVPAYNGGLFAVDTMLDELKITDNILYNHCHILSGYNFDTDVDVNILGHIFEHSLNELDEMTALANGTRSDKIETKRKKDGIFYTPIYITKHITEQTIGELCRRKQIELALNPNDIEPINDIEARNEVLQKITQYRNWLLQITILDPACGSGAFLNQAFTFLIDEHRLIDAMLATLLGKNILITDNTSDILANNLFGVDINEESVEITRLSLWLRSAKIGRKLNDLNQHIICGNSLINNSDIAPNLAFDWQNKFPEVFQNGGFDVVIGNPPYVRQETLPTKQKEYLFNTYEVGNKMADLYTYFYEKGIEILRPNGLLGYITANKFIKANYGKSIRQYLSQFQILEIVDFGELPVFADAATCPSIFIIEKQKPKKSTQFVQIQNLQFGFIQEADKICFDIDASVFASEQWQLVNNEKKQIFEKLKKTGIPLKKYANGQIYRGILTGFNEAFVIDKTTRNRLIAEDPNSAQIIKPFLAGDNVRFYHINFEEKYLILTKIGIDINQYPAIFKHLQQYQLQLKKRTDQGKFYWELRPCDYYNDFDNPKIIYPEIAMSSRFSMDIGDFYLNKTIFFIPIEDWYLLALLNSHIVWFYLKLTCAAMGNPEKGGRLNMQKIYIESIPIPVAQVSPSIKQQLAQYAKKMLALHTQLHEMQNSFIQILRNNLTLTKLTTKLESWYNLSFKELLSELSKQKINIPLQKQSEWNVFFDKEKKAILNTQFEISVLNKTINTKIYNLYQLTPKEITLIELSNT